MRFNSIRTHACHWLALALFALTQTAAVFAAGAEAQSEQGGAPAIECSLVEAAHSDNPDMDGNDDAGEDDLSPDAAFAPLPGALAARLARPREALSALAAQHLSRRIPPVRAPPASV